MSTTAKLSEPAIQQPSASPQSAGSWSARTAARLLFGALPNVIVFGLLAGVFLLGQQTEWKLPKLHAILGHDTAVAKDWCSEHAVPESQCVECKPDLMTRPPEFGWCDKHGVAECVICHPELAHVKGDPQLPQYDTAAPLALLPRTENNSRSTLHKRRIQFASDETLQKEGVDVDVVQVEPMQEALAANGELSFDPTRMARLAPRASGTLRVVTKKRGDPVAAGEVLALVDSSAVGQAKAQLLQALLQENLARKNAERARAIADGLAGRTLLERESAAKEAQGAVVAARQSLINLGFEVPAGLEGDSPEQLDERLRFLGLPRNFAAHLPEQTQTTNLLPVISPITGTVVSSNAVVGQVVDAEDVLFTIADPSQIWANLQMRAEEVRLVKTGLTVHFQPDDGGRSAAGVIDWIAPAMDPVTRTVEVRVVLDNSDHALRDGSFGTGRIVLRDEPNAIVVPPTAVQSAGDETLVFVRDKHYFEPGAPKVFHVRQVRVGAKNDRHVELLAGVLPGEVIATTGSNVLLSQLLRANLGAGCGCHEQK